MLSASDILHLPYPVVTSALIINKRIQYTTEFTFKNYVEYLTAPFSQHENNDNYIALNIFQFLNLS